MTIKEELKTLRQKFDNVGIKIRGLIDDYNLQKLSIERLTDKNNEIEENLNDLAYEIEQGEPREQYGSIGKYKFALEEIEKITDKCDCDGMCEYPCDIGEIKAIINKAKEQE